MTTTSAFCDDQWPNTAATPPTDVAGYIGLRIDPPSNHAQFTYSTDQPWTYCQLLVKADLEMDATLYVEELTRALEAIIGHFVYLSNLRLNLDASRASVTSAERDRLDLLKVRLAADLHIAREYQAKLEKTLHLGSIGPFNNWYSQLSKGQITIRPSIVYHFQAGDGSPTAS